MRYKNTLQFLLLIACLVFGVFQPKTGEAKSAIAPVLNTEYIEASNSTPSITVSTVQTSLSSIALSSSCLVQNTLTENFVQDQLLLNFNQPADCFSLVLGEVVVQPRLAVVVASPMSSIVLPARQSTAMHNPEFLSNTSIITPGAIPERALDLLLFFEAIGFLWLVIFAMQSLRKRMRTYSVYELSMLRC